MTSPINGASSVWPLSSAQNSSASTARADVMTAVAKQLGVSTSQLQSELQSGQSLTQVAQAAGISSDQLNSTVTSALQNANLPAGADISAIASRMENHVGGHHHHGGGGGLGDQRAVEHPRLHRELHGDELHGDDGLVGLVRLRLSGTD